MQPQSETEVRAEAGGLYGTREWKYLVYPLATGRLDLPEASLRVFDPVKASWTDLVYTPGTVSVSPSTKTNSDSGQLSEVLPKIDCPLPQSDSLPVAISLQMALAILFPALLWCIIAIIIARLRTRREADTTGYAKRTAGKAALSSLRGDSKNADIPALVENVLRNYAIQRTMAPPGVTTEGLASFLREAGVKLDAVDRWQALLDKAVSFRYAGVISDPEQLLVEARQIIRDMEIQS
jgi:hypothetical protein